MAGRDYQSLARPDSAILAACKKIDAELGTNGESTININVISGVTGINGRTADMDANPHMVALAAANTAVSVSFQQVFGPPPYSNAYWTVNRQQGIDAIHIEVPNQVDPATATKFILAVQTHLPGFESTADLERVLGPELQEFYRRREASVLRLEELSQRLIDQNEAYRRTLDKTLIDERTKLATEKQEYLEGAKKEFETKEAAVKEHEKKLETREKALDDRTSRHVRRQIRKDFLEKLAGREKQFTLSQATNEKRRPIHLQFGLLLLVSGVIGASGLVTVMETPSDLYAILRLAIGAVGVAASTVYYIRWSDSWFRQHADEEFSLQRLALDFDRASWVVEMALEWQQEKEGEFPRELVDRLTANLFVSGKSLEALRHPAEELASALLNASSSVKLPLPGGGELNMDRKGIKSLS